MAGALSRKAPRTRRNVGFAAKKSQGVWLFNYNGLILLRVVGAPLGVAELEPERVQWICHAGISRDTLKLPGGKERLAPKGRKEVIDSA